MIYHSSSILNCSFFRQSFACDVHSLCLRRDPCKWIMTVDSCLVCSCWLVRMHWLTWLRASQLSFTVLFPIWWTWCQVLSAQLSPSRQHRHWPEQRSRRRFKHGHLDCLDRRTCLTEHRSFLKLWPEHWVISYQRVLFSQLRFHSSYSCCICNYWSRGYRIGSIHSISWDKLISCMHILSNAAYRRLHPLFVRATCSTPSGLDQLRHCIPESEWLPSEHHRLLCWSLAGMHSVSSQVSVIRLIVSTLRS